jgi:photosystem II stability/assembly factor-like uncharacterized protein
MNDIDFDRDLEADLRSELRRSIVPPPTPEYVRARVERIATRAIEEPRRGPINLAAWRGQRSGVMDLAAVVVIVAIIGAGLAWRGVGPGNGADRPVAPPTLPGTPGPSFPPAPDAASSKTVTMSAWADGLTGIISVADVGMRITHDGGVTWSALASAPAHPTDPDFDFVDATHGFVSSVDVGAAVTSVSVYRTSDGARTWRVAQVTTPPTEAGWQVDASSHFSDASHGIVLVTRFQSDTLQTQECQLFTTDDGGASWTGKGTGPCLGVLTWPNWSTLQAGFISSPTDPSSVITTVDGGRTWLASELPDASPGWRVVPQLFIVDRPGQLRLLASMTPTTNGQYTPRTPAVYSSSDGGATWTKEYEIGSIADATRNILGLSVYSVSALGPDYWLALQQGSGIEHADMLVRTLDAGRTWSVMPSTGFTTADGMGWWDARHGMLQGMEWVCNASDSSCGSDHPTVFMTNDGGLTWHQVPF